MKRVPPKKRAELTSLSNAILYGPMTSGARIFLAGDAPYYAILDLLSDLEASEKELFHIKNTGIGKLAAL